jgi:adenosylcobinamide-phosphate synthase
MAGMSGNVGILLAALALEACVGYPRRLVATIGHPVMWIGRLLDACEGSWNDPRARAFTRRLLGIVTVFMVVALAAGAGYAVTRLADQIRYGVVLIAVVATVGIAQRSLYEHVRDVLVALREPDLDAAREAVGRIVGRDTASLRAEEVSAAAIESLAESFNDAVVAPAFWFLVAGLPGLFAYKAINTADSMIGHKEERWRHFGWAAARLDDVVNLVPARLAGVLLACSAGRGFQTMWRDASKHASPNAGWPEAALAGALDVRLGGPASYDGVVHARPHFGDGGDAQVNDLPRALTLYKRACALQWLLLALIFSLNLSS